MPRRSPRSQRARGARRRPAPRRGRARDDPRRRTTRPATSCTRRRARSPKPRSKSAGSKREIRYVVEGRAARSSSQRSRTEQTQLGARREQRRSSRRREIEGRARGRRRSSRPRCSPRRLEEQDARAAASREALRAAQAKRPSAARRRRRCSSRSRCSRADPRNIEEQLRQLERSGASGSPASTQALARPIERAARAAARSSAQAKTRVSAPTRACTNCRSKCRRSTRPRASAEAVNAGSASAAQADLGARLDALQALQEKVQTEGKLQALARSARPRAACSGLWKQLHIEPGWETALEAALRERMNALEIAARLRRAFAADAPPAKLRLLHARRRPRCASAHRTLPRLADLLRLDDAGLKALLGDWLEGVYTARRSTTRCAARAKLAQGEVDHDARGPRRDASTASASTRPIPSRPACSRAQQEIENLEKQLRAQALIAEGAQPRWCAPRPPTATPRSGARARAAKRPKRRRARTSCRSSCCA